MPHTYKFADADKTTVVRDDGVTFPWPVGDTTTPGAVGANLGGRAGEEYRIDGCPMPAPFGAKDKAADKAKPKLKLRARKGAGKTKAGKKKAGEAAYVKDLKVEGGPAEEGTKERKPGRKPKAAKAKPKVKNGRKRK
jgi:hypothetical protein